MTASTQEIVAKALWADGNNRIGHRPWKTVRDAYMAEAGHAIAALVGNGLVIVERSYIDAAQEFAEEILASEGWFTTLDRASKDELSQPNHNSQQAENAIVLARLVLQNNGSCPDPGGPR